MKLKESDAEFKTAHLSLIDLIDDEDTLATEQAALDEHNIISSLDLCFQALINSIDSSTATKVDDRKILLHRLKQILECLSASEKAISTLSGEEKDKYQLKQHDEQLCDYKRDLSNVNLKPVLLDLPEVLKQHSHLEELMFACSLRIKELSHSSILSTTTSLPASTETKGVKLCKLDVPVLNGNIRSR